MQVTSCPFVRIPTPELDHPRPPLSMLVIEHSLANDPCLKSAMSSSTATGSVDINTHIDAPSWLSRHLERWFDRWLPLPPPSPTDDDSLTPAYVRSTSSPSDPHWLLVDIRNRRIRRGTTLTLYDRDKEHRGTTDFVKARVVYPCRLYTDAITYRVRCTDGVTLLLQMPYNPANVTGTIRALQGVRAPNTSLPASGKTWNAM